MYVDSEVQRSMHQALKLSNDSIFRRKAWDKEMLVCASVQKNKGRQQAYKLDAEGYAGPESKAKALGRLEERFTNG